MRAKCYKHTHKSYPRVKDTLQNSNRKNFSFRNVICNYLKGGKKNVFQLISTKFTFTSKFAVVSIGLFSFINHTMLGNGNNESHLIVVCCKRINKSMLCLVISF